MAKTKSDIATLALRRLGLVPAEQSPSAAMTALAEDSVTRVHKELAHHGVAFWPVEATPDDVASALAQYVAGDVASEFYKPEEAARYQAQMGTALRRMTLVAGVRDFSDMPVRFEAF